MKYRNIQVAKMTGVKILAGLLVFGLTFSAPATAWAAEGGLTEVTSNGSENGEKLQAKSIDGRDTLTEVSDLVLEMIHNEEIRYNEETGYLEDTGLCRLRRSNRQIRSIRIHHSSLQMAM